MLVAPDLANRFMHEYKRFLLAIYQPEAAGDEPKRMIEKLHSARKRFIANRGLLDEYLKTLEDGVEPIDREIETFGTERKKRSVIEDFAWNLLDMSVSGILKRLNLRRPIYRETARYGHFGRDGFPWEAVLQ